jgi:hypothetical protein
MRSRSRFQKGEKSPPVNGRVEAQVGWDRKYITGTFGNETCSDITVRTMFFGVKIFQFCLQLCDHGQVISIIWALSSSTLKWRYTSCFTEFLKEEHAPHREWALETVHCHWSDHVTLCPNLDTLESKRERQLLDVI